MSRKILVVEDDDEIRDALREILEDEGFTPMVAQNGRIALNLLETEPKPRVILLDLMMPVLNGWEFLEIQKKTEDLSKIPTIVLSAVAERQLPAGTVALRKPLNLNELLSLLNSCFSAKQPEAS